MPVITTTTDLSNYSAGDTIRISGSNCCWTIVGETEPDLSVRDVIVTQNNCYYYSVSESLSFGDVEIVTFN